MDLFDVLMTECISAPSSHPVDEFEGMSSLEPSPVVGDLNLKNLQIHYKSLQYCFFFSIFFFFSCRDGMNNSTHFWVNTTASFFFYTKVKLGFFIRTGFDFTEKETFLPSKINKGSFTVLLSNALLPSVHILLSHLSNWYFYVVLLLITFVSLLPVSVESAVAMAETFHTAVS